MTRTAEFVEDQESISAACNLIGYNAVQDGHSVAIVFRKKGLNFSHFQAQHQWHDLCGSERRSC